MPTIDLPEKRYQHSTQYPASKRIIPLKSIGNSVFRIRQICDTHQDAEGFRADVFREFINEQIKDKESAWIHTGDLPDADRPSTRRMKDLMWSDRKEAFKQADLKELDWIDRKIIPAYQKIADSCLGIIDGDHFILFSNGMTSGQYIARKLKVPYLGERSAWVDILFRDKTGHHAFRYSIHARHGKGGGGTEGGDVNALIKQEKGYFADLHLGSHSHKNNCHTMRTEWLNSQGVVKEKIVTYMRGGSFLDGFPRNGEKTYAYRKEYSPLPVGWGEAELHIGRPYQGRGHAQLMSIRYVKASIVSAV